MPLLPRRGAVRVGVSYARPIKTRTAYRAEKGLRVFSSRVLTLSGESRREWYGMARQIVVMCDVHLEQGQRVEAQELPPITVEGKGPRVLALCPEHKQDYYDPFVELVEDLGLETPEKNPTRAAPEEAQPPTSNGKEATATETDDSAGGSEKQDVSESQREDPAQVIAESPTMSALPDEADAARWECPVDDCDKSYSASGEHRAEDLKRLGNLHLSTSHNLDKAARVDLLSA